MTAPETGSSIETRLATARLRVMYSQTPEARREAMAEVEQLRKVRQTAGALRDLALAERGRGG